MIKPIQIFVMASAAFLLAQDYSPTWGQISAVQSATSATDWHSRLGMIKMKYAKEYREEFCKNGLDDICLSTVTFSTFANLQSSQSHDLGVRLSFQALNEAYRNPELKNKWMGDPVSVQGASLYFNDMLEKYNAEKQKATGVGKTFSDEDSIKLFFQLIKSAPIPHAEVAAQVAEAYVKMYQQVSKPFEEASAQNNMIVYGNLLESMGDTYGDLRFLSSINPYYKQMVNPLVVTYFGYPVDASSESILKNEPLVKSILLGAENHQLLLDMQSQLKQQQKMNAADAQKLNKRILDAIKKNSQIPRSQDSKSASPTAEQLQNLQTLEAGLKIGCAITNLISDPQARATAEKTMGLGKAMVSLYKISLNPEGLSKMLLTANVIGTVSELFSMFMGGGDNGMQQLGEQIEALQQQVGDLRETVLKGFEMTNMKLDQIFDAMQNGFKDLHEQNLVTQERLQIIREGVSTLEHRLNSLSSDLPDYVLVLSDRVLGDSSALCFHAKELFDNYTISDAQFADCIARIYRGAVELPSDQISTRMNVSDFNFLQNQPWMLVDDKFQGSFDYRLKVAENNTFSSNPLKILNYLATESVLHTDYSFWPKDENKPLQIPSPYAWVAGSSAFRTLLGLYPEHNRGNTHVTLPIVEKIKQEGEKLVQVARAIRSEAFLNAYAKKHAALEDSLRLHINQLSVEVATHANLAEYKDVIWGDLPKDTAYQVTLPLTIPKNTFGQDRDLPVSIPTKDVPAFARLALLLGVGTLDWQWSLVGDDLGGNNRWEDEEPAGQAEVTEERPNPSWSGDGTMKTSIRTWGTAYMHLQGVARINGHDVYQCDWRSENHLTLGKMTRRQIRKINPKDIMNPIVVSTDVIKREYRSVGDVLGQIWQDNDNHLHDQVTCHEVTKDASNFGRDNRKAWRKMQLDNIDVVGNALNRGDGGTYSLSFAAIAKSMDELTGLESLFTATASFGMAELIEKDDSIANALFGDTQLAADTASLSLLKDYRATKTRVGELQNENALQNMGAHLSELHRLEGDERQWLDTRIQSTLENKRKAFQKTFATALAKVKDSQQTVPEVDTELYLLQALIDAEAKPQPAKNLP